MSESVPKLKSIYPCLKGINWFGLVIIDKDNVDSFLSFINNLSENQIEFSSSEGKLDIYLDKNINLDDILKISQILDKLKGNDIYIYPGSNSIDKLKFLIKEIEKKDKSFFSYPIEVKVLLKEGENVDKIIKKLSSNKLEFEVLRDLSFRIKFEA